MTREDLLELQKHLNLLNQRVNVYDDRSYHAAEMALAIINKALIDPELEQEGLPTSKDDADLEAFQRENDGLVHRALNQAELEIMTEADILHYELTGEFR